MPRKPAWTESQARAWWSALKGWVGVQQTLESRDALSSSLQGPSQPLLSVCPHHLGAGVWWLLWQEAELGGAPSGHEAPGKQRVRDAGSVAPGALFLCHLKHFRIKSALNASPDVSSDLLFMSSRQNSMLSLFLPFWLCDTPVVPACSHAGGCMSVPEGRVTHRRAPVQVTGSAHTVTLQGNPGKQAPQGQALPLTPSWACELPTPSAETWPPLHSEPSTLQRQTKAKDSRRRFGTIKGHSP